jgi:hypothetical protein
VSSQARAADRYLHGPLQLAIEGSFIAMARTWLTDIVSRLFILSLSCVGNTTASLVFIVTSAIPLSGYISSPLSKICKTSFQETFRSIEWMWSFLRDWQSTFHFVQTANPNFTRDLCGRVGFKRCDDRHDVPAQARSTSEILLPQSMSDFKIQV